jgi:hypothetical protein
MVNSFDPYDTAVNGDFHQVVNGSCRDTFGINATAWAKAYATPPTTLIEGYYRCHYTPMNCVITAFGVGSGTANAIVPVTIILFCFLIMQTGLPRMKLKKELYTDEARQRAIEHLATHLLMIRDAQLAQTAAGGVRKPRPTVAQKFLADLVSADDTVFLPPAAQARARGQGNEEMKVAEGDTGRPVVTEPSGARRRRRPAPNNNAHTNDVEADAPLPPLNNAAPVDVAPLPGDAEIDGDLLAKLRADMRAHLPPPTAAEGQPELPPQPQPQPQPARFWSFNR